MVAGTLGGLKRSRQAFSEKQEPARGLCVPSLRSLWAAGSHHFVALVGRVGVLEPRHPGGLGS